MENLTRTAVGTLAALVLGLAVGGGAGALAFGGDDDNKSGAGEASLDDATTVPDKELPFFLVNRPGYGYDLVPKPGFKLDLTGEDTFHVINLDPPPDPPSPKSDDPPPLPPIAEKDPPPPPAPPAEQPKAPEEPKLADPITPEQAEVETGPLAPTDPIITPPEAKKKAPKGCKTKKQKKSKKCRPPKKKGK